MCGRGCLQGPMPAAGHAAAVLLCWRGLGGPPPHFGVLVVPLAEFASSPHCRLPGNTTCQQNAVGLLRLLPLRILQPQAGGIPLERDWPPVPGAGGRAVILGLEGWKTAGYSCWCGGTPGQSWEVLVCFSLTGIVWLWEVEPRPVMALLWELSLLRGKPSGPAAPPRAPPAGHGSLWGAA